MLAIDASTTTLSAAESIVKQFNAWLPRRGCTEKRLHLSRDESGTYTLSWDYMGYKPLIILARNVNDREVALIVKALAAW